MNYPIPEHLAHVINAAVAIDLLTPADVYGLPRGTIPALRELRALANLGNQSNPKVRFIARLADAAIKAYTPNA